MIARASTQASFAARGALRLALFALLAICAALALGAARARAAETVKITSAGFRPDKLGVPTDVFGSATIASTTGPVPSPITHVNIYGPAGVTLDLTGSTTCSEETLKNIGPRGCPANSLAGTGGGEGIYELGKEIINEEYKLYFFVADNRPGHTALRIFLIGSTPTVVEVVFPPAPVINGPKPYGLGLSITVPLIKVLPEASNASATSSSLLLGAKGQTYLASVHGKRERRKVRGIITPPRCPRGGWPVASQFTFEDGSVASSTAKVPCPH